jgi:hypothetical protein
MTIFIDVFIVKIPGYRALRVLDYKVESFVRMQNKILLHLAFSSCKAIMSRNQLGHTK